MRQNPGYAYDLAATKLTEALHFLQDRQSYAEYRKSYGDNSGDALIGHLSRAWQAVDKARIALRMAQAEETN